MTSRYCLPLLFRDKYLFVFCFYTQLVFFSSLVFNFFLMGVSIVLGCVISLFGYKDFFNKEFNVAKLYLSLALFSMFIVLPVSLMREPKIFFFFFASAVSMIVAYVFSKHQQNLILAVRYTLIVYQFYILWFFFNSTEYQPLDSMITGNSSNVVTSYLLVINAVYVFFSGRLGVSAPLFTTLMTLYICYLGFGRGSLVVGFLLFFYVFITFIVARVKVFSRGFSFLFLLFVFFVFVGLFLYFYDGIVNHLLSKTKLSAGFADSSRTEMYLDYFHSLDFMSFIFGGDFSGTSIDSKYNGNPHSSLIWAHHNFGLLYVAVLVLGFFVLTSLEKNKSLVFFTLGLIFLRSLSEPFMLPSLIDFFIFVIFFSVMREFRIVRTRPIS